MNWAALIAEHAPNCPASQGDDLREMQEDIYYHFSKMDGFEVVRVEQTGDKEKQVIAVCISTMEDPFFKIKEQFGWHLTIKSFLEINNNFKRYERSPLKEIDKKEMLKCKKIFEYIKTQINIKKLNKYLG